MSDEQERTTWSVSADEASHRDFPGHVAAIAHGRYVLRQVIRILDDCAVEGALQPLSHQALIQVYGARVPLSVSGLADRLSIPAALASRVVRGLQDDGLVRRVRTEGDRRVVHVEATEAGETRLRVIDQAVHDAIGAFAAGLDDDGRVGALATFASYVGLDADPRIRALFTDVEYAAHG